MKYHAQTKQFTVDIRSIEMAALNLQHAIKYMRQHAGLPLTPYDNSSIPDSDAFWAIQAILDAANQLGIDLGATRSHKVDVSNIS